MGAASFIFQPRRNSMDEFLKSQTEMIVGRILHMFLKETGNGMILGSLQKDDGSVVGTILAIHCADPALSALLQQEIAALISSHGGAMVEEQKVPEEEQLDWGNVWIH
jgi:hypothetical protein